MTELETAANKLREAIKDYNSAYRGATLGAYSRPSFDIATSRFDRRLGRFTKMAREESEKTKQVPALVVEIFDHLTDNGFLAPALKEIVNNYKEKE